MSEPAYESRHQARSSSRLADSPDLVKGGDGGSPPVEILGAAHAHFRDGSIGAPNKYERPFTVQLKNDTRRQFPIDERFYLQAEAAQRSVLRMYVFLQLIEVAMLAALILVQASLFAGSRLPDWLQWLPMANLSTPIAFVAGLSVALAGAGLRRGFRWYFFHEIERKAERLSYDVFKRIDDISTNVTDACLKSRNRKGRGEWSERARDWIIVAIWNAKRAEYLDRFITTIIWAVRTYILHVEAAAVTVKFALSLAIGVAVFDASTRAAAAGSLGFILGLILQAVIIWLVWGRKPDDFWTRVFRSSANEHEESLEPYADKIASVVENLVHEALGKEFGAAGKKQ